MAPAAAQARTRSSGPAGLSAAADDGVLRKVVPLAVDADDRAWAIYKKADSDAGDDCRDKLDAVDAVVKGWARTAQD